MLTFWLSLLKLPSKCAQSCTFMHFSPKNWELYYYTTTSKEESLLLRKKHGRHRFSSLLLLLQDRGRWGQKQPRRRNCEYSRKDHDDKFNSSSSLRLQRVLNGMHHEVISLQMAEVWQPRASGNVDGFSGVTLIYPICDHRGGIKGLVRFLPHPLKLRFF